MAALETLWTMWKCLIASDDTFGDDPFAEDKMIDDEMHLPEW
jgi:hypothetical protein